MNYELIKNKVTKLKKEELAYIDNITKISSTKTLSEYEKLEVYRNLKNYKNKLKELLKDLWSEIQKSKRLTRENLQDVIIEFDVSKNYLSAVKFESEQIRKDILEAAKRELKEETGYISDDLFVIDYSYTSPGIDNSITYVVVADNCIKTDEKSCNGTELVNYGLFSKIELDYLINQNIIGGAMNKLAYYNFINKGDDFLTDYVGRKKKELNLITES